MPTLTAFIYSLIITAAIGVAGGALFLYSGLYPIGADVPHNRLTYWILETLRERSVARAASDLVVPADLKASERLLAGGADYNDMCAACHLKPGESDNDLSQGLYPAPPNLTLSVDDHAHEHEGDSGNDDALRRRFWIIKHGIKASGMPAWGYGHDDERIWSLVAFLDRLHELSPAQYQIITARAGSSE